MGILAILTVLLAWHGLARVFIQTHRREMDGMA